MAKKDQFDTSTLAKREAIAENMKERVYSSITLLAVMAVMWQEADHKTPLSTIAYIASTVFALWAATLIAIRMSYRAVHGKSISRHEYTKAFFTSSGLLAPAIPPIIIVAICGLTQWYSLETALMASIIISLLSLFALSFAAGRKIYDNPWKLILVSALEMSVGIAVVLLKLAIGE